ncbi:major facilitator superfamily-domain-containing protein [Penicillium cosmopolitanum]|uniref:Major facilitator superfamily-domain-containing protein n=1 Tax=Penicillium cosmopolitanum TaxID=1131564 RepID=A0A9W9VGQ8_9EURO|nr:major facilitator superfamily-domain-containing protein [Penicillium cosmopolitanum]KAJ5378910.1 major facilitator superfamily-domain-containing protein [Penicillium cosmopolitanum]
MSSNEAASESSESHKIHGKIPGHENNGKDMAPSLLHKAKQDVTAEAKVNVTLNVEQENQWATGFKLFNIIGALGLVCLLMLLDTSIISTAVPRITSEFNSLPDVGWYGSAYQLASAAIQPLTGRIYMNLSTKWTFLSFFFIFELGSLICGLATSSKMLIVGRAIAGIGGSGILNGAFTIIAACVPLSRRPTFIGLVMGVSQVGLSAGPLIGGALTEYTTWRWCFYINLPVGGLVAVMFAFVNIPEIVPKQKFAIAIRALPGQLDLLGFALFASSAIQLLLALQYGGNKFAWNSSQIIGLFCGSGTTFLVFLLWDHRQGEKAMIPFSLIRKRIIWSSSLSYGFLLSQVFCVSWYLPQYFQGVKNASPLMSGVDILPSILAHFCVATISGKIIERLGYYLPIILTSASLMAVGNGLLSTLSPHTSPGKWIGYQILLGATRALGLQVPIIAIQHVLPSPQIPVATALAMFSQLFTGALFLSFSDTVFTNSLSSLIPKYAPSTDPKIIINAGATGFRSYVSGQDLAGSTGTYCTSKMPESLANIFAFFFAMMVNGFGDSGGCYGSFG